jgi:hypothetical protein
MQVTEAQNAAGTDSAPGTAQQQQQQADALSAAAQQPDKASAILSEAAKPLEAPEPDQYSVGPSSGQKHHYSLLTLKGPLGFKEQPECWSGLQEDQAQSLALQRNSG